MAVAEGHFPSYCDVLGWQFAFLCPRDLFLVHCWGFSREGTAVLYRNDRLFDHFGSAGLVRSRVVFSRRYIFLSGSRWYRFQRFCFRKFRRLVLHNFLTVVLLGIRRSSLRMRNRVRSNCRRIRHIRRRLRIRSGHRVRLVI